MKKITLLFLFFVSIMSQGQTCNQVFTITGQDDDPTVLSINNTEVTCYGGTLNTLTISAATLGNADFCNVWYSYEMNIDGVVSTVCASDLVGMDISSFSNITITSSDLPSDNWSDFITMSLTITADYTATAIPNCDVSLITPVDGDANVGLTGNISWSEATGGVAGYYLKVGTTSGGSNVLASTDISNVVTYALGTLLESTTYYVSIVPYNSIGNATGCSEFSFTTRDPIQGDFCSTVIDLGLEASPYTGSTVDASNDNIPSCSTSNASDIYYSIMVPNGSTLTIGQTSNDYDSAVSVYYGDCTNLTEIDCFDDPDYKVVTWANNTGNNQTIYWVQDGYNGNSGTYTLEWSIIACTNATATYTVVSDCGNGEQFLINVDISDLGTATSLTVSDDQGSATQNVTTTGIYHFGPYTNATPVIFTIANDQDSNCFLTSTTLTQAICPPDCATATVIANCGDDTVADMVAGQGYWNVNTCGFTTNGTELLYSFTPTITGVYSLEVTGAPGFNYIDYFYKVADNVCDNTGWTCIDDNSVVGIDSIGELTAGVTYLILLDGENTNAKSQTFRINCAPTCTNATVSYAVVSDCPNSEGFFVDVNITDLGTATSITVSDDQGSANQAVTATGISHFGPYTNGTSVVFTVANDQDDTCILTSTAQTQLACPPNNDNCAGAIQINAGGTFNENVIVTSNVGGSTITGLTYNCQTNRVDDVWYSLVVPNTTTLTLETAGVEGSLMNDTVMSVFSGTCGAFTEIGCNDDITAGTNNFSKINLTGLTPGQIIYIGVWRYSFGTGADDSFQLSAYDASLANSTFSNTGFSAFPNPVKNVLNISYNKNITNVAVFNLLGQEVATKYINATQSQIDMSNLSKGTYLVKVTADNQVKTIKVIKE